MNPKLRPRPVDRVHESWIKSAGVTSFQGLSVLDVGCGSGYLCSEAMDQGAALAYGLDICEPEYRDSQNGWTFVQADLESPDWPTLLPGSFDLILALDIIEHIASPYNFLLQCTRLMKAGVSRMILTTPNINSWERLARPRSWSGAENEQHKTLFNRYSLEFLLEKAGYFPTETFAPVKALKFLGKFSPNWGGQIIACTSVPPKPALG